MSKINYAIDNYKKLLEKFNLLFITNTFIDDGKRLREFINLFDQVTDERVPYKCKYSTKFIVVITFLAIFDERETWQEIADFAYDRKDILEKYLEYSDTIPSHDTFMRVFSLINSATLENTVIHFLKECIKLVVHNNINKSDDALNILAIDGKQIKGSGRKYDTDEVITNNQIMHFWDVSDQMCIKSVAISEKTNEIPVAQQVLSGLDLKNKIVTADAMNTQKKTVEIIIKNKGDYVLALKANHNDFYDNANKLFNSNLEEIKKDNKNYFKMEIEKNHNQVEKREFFRIDGNKFTEDTEWLSLNSVVCYKKTMFNVIKKTENIEVRYYISSLKNIELIAEAIRKHWSVENQLHWVLDSALHEDFNSTINKKANFNFSILRKMVITLVRLLSPLFRNGSFKRTIKSFRSDYETNIVKLFKFLDGQDISEILKTKKETQ